PQGRACAEVPPHPEAPPGGARPVVGEAWTRGGADLSHPQWEAARPDAGLSHPEARRPAGQRASPPRAAPHGVTPCAAAYALAEGGQLEGSGLRHGALGALESPLHLALRQARWAESRRGDRRVRVTAEHVHEYTVAIPSSIGGRLL